MNLLLAHLPQISAASILRTPLGRRVKVIEQGTGTPVVFLHSGVGSVGESKPVFSLWPEGYRLLAIEAYRDGSGGRSRLPQPRRLRRSGPRRR